MLKKLLSRLTLSLALVSAPVLAASPCSCGEKCECTDCHCNDCPHHK